MKTTIIKEHGFSNIQSIFEDWILEAGVNMKGRILSYYIKKVEYNTLDKIQLGFNNTKTKTILVVVTDSPSWFIGSGNGLVDKYKRLMNKPDGDLSIDDIEICEVHNQRSIAIGVRKKILDLRNPLG